MTLFFLCLLCVLRGELAIDEGYLGAKVVDNAAGQTVFSWFSPGPLDGAGLQSNVFDLHRPDVLVSVDGKAMNAAEFNAYIASLAPGVSVTIQYLKATQRDTADIPGTVATDGEAQTIAVVLESKEEYTGTIGRLNTIGRKIEFTTPPLLDPFDPENVLGAAVAEHGLQDEIEKLMGVFRDTIEETTDTHMLPYVRAAFQNPFCLVESQEVLNSTTAELADEPRIGEIMDLVARAIYVGYRVGTFDGSTYESEQPTTDGGEVMNDILARAGIFGRIVYRDLTCDSDTATDALDLLRVPRESFYISGTDAQRHLAVIRDSTYMGWRHFLNMISPAAIEWEYGTVDLVALHNLAASDPPPELMDAVEGKILEAFKTSEGWVVVGSSVPNRYDMMKIAAVYDIGGDDDYWASDLRIGTRAIIDLAGDDTYTGTPDQGPGGAILGVSFIDDRAGNDTYKGEMLSCGAAIYGVSLLLDRGGDDTYSGTDWSMGAAVYGAGMLIDLGEGSDTYTGEFLCQGVGGPRGFGAIIDEGGDDRYMANGPQPSIYGTPDVFCSFSQGVGFGYRGYAAGGIGMLSDLGGNDHYESGEFSQGGAYYFALGILHDAEGNDEYIGNRYGQGFGVHQAFGILADDAGDDVYTSMTAASQGAAWDIGAGLLIDRAGDDIYTCDGLGQGGASMQGIAMLIDLAGDDKYNASGGATQGESGGNSYHFAETGAFSFSLLWDEGSAVDFFSRGRENNKVTSTGVVNEADSANSGAHGLVIDR